MCVSGPVFAVARNDATLSPELVWFQKGLSTAYQQAGVTLDSQACYLKLFWTANYDSRIRETCVKAKPPSRLIVGCPTYIYIYIYREREREICMYTRVHLCLKMQTSIILHVVLAFTYANSFLNI